MKVFELLYEQPVVKPGPTGGSIGHMGKKVGPQPAPYKNTKKPVTPIKKISYLMKNIPFLIKKYDLEEISDIAQDAAKSMFKDVKDGHLPKHARDWVDEYVEDNHGGDMDSWGHDRAQDLSHDDSMEALFKHLPKKYSDKKDLVNAAIETLQQESPWDFKYSFDEHPKYGELKAKYGDEFIEKFEDEMAETHTQIENDSYDEHLYHYRNQLESFLDEIAKRLGT